MANADSLIEKFDSLVNEDVVSKGSWKEDYDLFCEKYGVIPCPFITVSPTKDETESCRVANCEVDISSWRAMLLACSTVGSKVADIYVHNTLINSQHLLDLSKALKKSSVCKAIRLQYISVKTSSSIVDEGSSTPPDGTDSATIDALKALLSDETCIEYLSLKGNKFTDAIILPHCSGYWWKP